MRKEILLLVCILFLLSPLYSFSQEKTIPDSNSIKILQLEEKLNRKMDSLAHEDEHMMDIIDLRYDNSKNIFFIVMGALAVIMALVVIYLTQTYKSSIEKKVEEKVEEKVTDKAIDDIIQKEGEKKVKELIEDLEKKSKEIIKNAEKEFSKKLLELGELSSNYEKRLIELDEVITKKKVKITAGEIELKDISYKDKDEKDFSANDWINKAFDETEKKNFLKALIFLDKAEIIKTDDKFVFLLRGFIYEQILDYEKSLKYYTKAIDLDNDFTEAFDYRGNIYLKEGKYEKAISDFNKVIEKKPYEASNYNNIGVAYHNMNEYNKAIEYYSKAIELEKDFVRAYNNRGITYDKLGELENAKADFEKAKELIREGKEI